MPERRVRGAKVQGTFSVQKLNETLAVFDEVWDSHQYFRPVESTTALKIHRKELNGLYEVRVAVRWMNPWSVASGPSPGWGSFQDMEFTAEVLVNGVRIGNDARATAMPVLKATGTTQYFAVDTDLRKGDSVELRLFQTVESTVNATAFLEIRRLGPMVMPKLTSGTIRN